MPLTWEGRPRKLRGTVGPPGANLEEQNLHTRSRSRPAPRWARAHDVMLLARIEGEQQASGKALAATAAAAGAVYRSSR